MAGTGILPGGAALLFSPAWLTSPRMFKNAGDVSGAIGKWHIGWGDGTAPVDFNKRIKLGRNFAGCGIPRGAQ